MLEANTGGSPPDSGDSSDMAAMETGIPRYVLRQTVGGGHMDASN